MKKIRYSSSAKLILTKETIKSLGNSGVNGVHKGNVGEVGVHTTGISFELACTCTSGCGVVA